MAAVALVAVVQAVEELAARVVLAEVQVAVAAAALVAVVQEAEELAARAVPAEVQVAAAAAAQAAGMVAQGAGVVGGEVATESVMRQYSLSS